ncbi:hypothetical protein E2C01_087778 [Portunus trituberculatus]|uniref:Uncharacterized protein n=1 Tax=Portunus trituberculatus TaxID=210409 RepID=A0A5B7JKA1_PORTR|nr:hypothetical protein [Portunus trituberculatus]
MNPTMDKKLMAEIRMLKGTDIIDILQRTPRPFGRCTRFILGSNHLAVQEALRPGEGMVCGIEHAGVNHAVAVYHCPDGHYVYYDNENHPPNANFHLFCSRIGVQRRFIKRIYTNTNTLMYATCAYHALTFLDFAVRCRQTNVFRIMTEFKRYLGCQPDVKVILNIQAMLGEFHHDLSLSIRDTYNARSIVPAVNYLFNPHPYLQTRIPYAANQPVSQLYQSSRHSH